MSWEPNSEEIRLRQQNEEIRKIQREQFFSNTNIDVGETSSNAGTVNGLSGFNFGAVGDVIQDVINLSGGIISVVGSLIRLARDIINDPAGVVIVNFLNGGGTNNEGVVGQKVTLKPNLGESILLKDNPTTNASTLGNLILGGVDITITDTELITMRFQDDVKFSDSIGGWIVDSTGGTGSGGSSGIKTPCRVASTANNFAHPLWGDNIDGVTVVEGERFLVKDQTTSADNGIYVVGAVVATVHTATRATDFANASIQTGSLLVAVQEGTANADTLWQLTTNDVITVGTTPLSFTQFTGGSDNLGNHTATQSLKMKDFSVVFDTAELMNIISVGNSLSYSNDISIGGSHDFYIDDLIIPKFGITETSVETNVNIDMNGKSVTSSVDPTTSEMRIVFDGHLDSDTYISNSATTDVIKFVSNAVNIMEVHPTELLLAGTFNLNMNTSDIIAVGNMDFGAGAPPTGRLRMPNGGTIRWESVTPTGNYGDISMDSDENFFFNLTTATSAHQFWVNSFQVSEFNSAGLKMFQDITMQNNDITMGTGDIIAVGNMDFGAGSATSGRIRLPNTASIKWEGAPAGADGEISFDVDEKFFFASPYAGGAFGFWVNSFLTVEINSTGLDMQSNKISNINGSTINDLGTVTAVTGDFVMIRDATDGAMKKVNASDFLGGGSGGSQTPWTSDIDADGFDLNDLSNIEFRTTTGVPAITVQYIHSDLNGMRFNVPTGDDFTWSVNGAEQIFVSVTQFSSSVVGKNLGSSVIPWEKFSVKDIEIETGGTLTSTKNNITSDSFGMAYNVPSGDWHTFRMAGNPILIIEEDEIRFGVSGKQPRINATTASLALTAQAIGDTVRLITGTSRTADNISVGDVATVWRTGTSDTQAILLQLIQNNDTPADFRTIGNIDFMAENSVSADTVYGRISCSSQDITDATEDGLIQLGIVSAGTLISAIDIEGGTSASSGAKIGFFASTPVLKQTVAGDTLANLYTALRNYGLIV